MPKCVFSVIVVCIAVLVVCSTTQAAPAPAPAAMHTFSSYNMNASHYLAPLPPWAEPCGRSPSKRSTMDDQTQADRWLKALNDALNLFTIRPLHWNVIDTNDIAEWFTQNDTYKFLKRHDQNEKPKPKPRQLLLRWYNDTQVYVGTFDDLVAKQADKDHKDNDGNATKVELMHMLTTAKALLCELNSDIQRANLSVPVAMSRSEMSARLQFRSRHEPDTLDLKFAKVRFIEFLHALRAEVLDAQHRAIKSARQFKLRAKSITARKNRQKLQRRLRVLRQKISSAETELNQSQRKRKLSMEQRRETETAVAEWRNKCVRIEERLEKLRKRLQNARAVKVGVAEKRPLPQRRLQQQELQLQRRQQRQQQRLLLQQQRELDRWQQQKLQWQREEQQQQQQQHRRQRLMRQRLVRDD